MNKGRGSALALVAAFALSSCGPDGATVAPVFKPTYVLSESSRYGVVSGEFVNAREKAGREGAETNLVLRSGDLVHVIGYDFVRGRESDGGYWYMIEAEGKSGWIPSDAVRVFSSLEQARAWVESGSGK